MINYRRETDSVTITERVKTYVDVSLSFKPSPVTNDITLLTNENAINNSLKNIIMFLPTEVPFDPEVGSLTQRYLFDIMDEATGGLLASEVERAILFCEPRVSFRPLDERKVSTSELYRNNSPSGVGDLFYQDDLGVYVEVLPDQNAFQVTVKYRIVGGEKVYRFQTILTPTR